MEVQNKVQERLQSFNSGWGGTLGEGSGGRDCVKDPMQVGCTGGRTRRCAQRKTVTYGVFWVRGRFSSGCVGLTCIGLRLREYTFGPPAFVCALQPHGSP